MFFIAGNKIYNNYHGIKQLSKPCPYCNVTNEYQVTSVEVYRTFYWIQFYRSSKTAYAECTHCKKSFDIRAVHPIFNQPIQTKIRNEDGEIDFQILWKDPRFKLFCIMTFLAIFFWSGKFLIDHGIISK
ncbi:hypothetical protein SAMN06298216_1580 [Spirosomataceae bacterium TFI 002]|nr:hypothetical protein SAMN06298216_1580 [Spirosomataceae bacterium TFI 002]